MTDGLKTTLGGSPLYMRYLPPKVLIISYRRLLFDRGLCGSNWSIVINTLRRRCKLLLVFVIIICYLASDLC